MFTLYLIIPEISDPCNGGGNTPSPSPSGPPSGPPSGLCKGSCEDEGYKGDNYCDDGNNNCGCEYDGGDCCNPDANFSYCVFPCLCLDPEHEFFEKSHKKKPDNYPGK